MHVCVCAVQKFCCNIIVLCMLTDPEQIELTTIAHALAHKNAIHNNVCVCACSASLCICIIIIIIIIITSSDDIQPSTLLSG